MKGWLTLVAVLLAAGLFGWRLLHPALPAPTAAQARLPALQLATLKGAPLSLPVTGQAAIVNVFASWCVPCAAEVPLLKRLSAAGVAIYGIAYRDRPAALAGFLTRLGDPYAAVAMDTGVAATTLGITGVPESWLVAPDGTIRAHAEGALDEATASAWQAEIASWRN